MELPLPGRHVVWNALGGDCGGQRLEHRRRGSAESFRGLRTPAMRGELIRFTNGFALINDSYNSSPAALQAMISLLAATPGFSGAFWRREKCGNWVRVRRNCIARRGASRRRPAKLISSSACKATPRKSWKAPWRRDCRANTRNFLRTPAEAANFLADFVKPGDVLLVKGSRSVKMERIVEALLGRIRAGRRAGQRGCGPLRCSTTSSTTCCRNISAR